MCLIDEINVRVIGIRQGKVGDIGRCSFEEGMFFRRIEGTARKAEEVQLHCLRVGSQQGECHCRE